MDSKYYDLNVPRSAANAATIARLLDCEYLYLAITVSVNMDQFHFNQDDSQRKKSKEARQEMRQKILAELSPPSREDLEAILKDSEKFRTVKAIRPSICPPRLFTRLNLAFSDTEQVGLFFKEFSDQIRAYDILSLEPLNQSAFYYALDCTLPLDLISLDLMPDPNVISVTPTAASQKADETGTTMAEQETSCASAVAGTDGSACAASCAYKEDLLSTAEVKTDGPVETATTTTPSTVKSKKKKNKRKAQLNLGSPPKKISKVL
ncbi:unnamed protein product [Dibothriocephalus latus]|uniref:Uncharacterized protein n=1 Tax=Dibothriocephalus latus TaxID=60516 RepID=A0A3P7LPH4_DIBLA|nr:unnamed protein product [Dibothriocephalus latus]